MGIKDHINRAGFVVLVENFLPGSAAIGRPENAAFLVRTIRMSQRGDKSNVRILWMDNHRANVPRVFQSDVLPGPAAVERFVDAIAVRNIAANARLARANINNVVVRRRNLNRANRGDGFLIKNRRPVRARVSRFPNPARRRSKIENVRLTRYAGYS